MMNLATYTLAILMSLPSAYADRNEEGREARMKTIASAVTQATERASCTGAYSEDCDQIWKWKPEDLAALLVTKGWWESKFAKNVHEGRCRKDECDAAILPNGFVIHKARTPWQLQRTMLASPFWNHMVGTELEPTRNAAWVAAQILSKGMTACQSARGAIVWYGIGKCESERLLPRYQTFLKLKAMQPKR